MNDQLVTQHEAMDQHDNMTAKLREQITHLRDELTEKNNSILALETENEELVCDLNLHLLTYLLDKLTKFVCIIL